jgi:LCP family protein required for cell wall assembly
MKKSTFHQDTDVKPLTAVDQETPEAIRVNKPVGKPRRRWIRAVLATLLVLLIAFGGFLWLTINQHLNPFDADQTLAAPYDVPEKTLSKPLPSLLGVTNILLLGVDNRDPDSKSIAERSDTMMILTIDNRSGQIKLTSLQRDMAVYLPGEDRLRKLNTANARGGPLLTLRVIRETLRIDVQKFVVVNMAGLEQIIDAIGGVSVDVSENERSALNEELAMVNKTFPDTEPSPIVEATGIQVLNGRQAVTYARIRKNDSDYKRMERQREVMQAIVSTAVKAGPARQYKLLTVSLSNITTNLSVAEMAVLGLRSSILFLKPIAQLQLPIEGYFKEVNTDEWKILCDFNGMIPLVQDFIFGQTFPFDPVRKIEGY